MFVARSTDSGRASSTQAGTHGLHVICMQMLRRSRQKVAAIISHLKGGDVFVARSTDSGRASSTHAGTHGLHVTCHLCAGFRTSAHLQDTMNLFQSKLLWTCFRASYYGLVSERDTMDLFQSEILWTCSRAKHYGLVSDRDTMDLFQSKTLWTCFRAKHYGLVSEQVQDS